MEMAAASGLVLLAKAERDPRLTTTFGTGELIRAALDAGCNPLLVGVGGSATNDGGSGAAQALGARFLDSQGQPLPSGGAALVRLARIDVTGLDPRLKHTEICVAVDVQNPLYGPEGASQIYGPQKGATPDVVNELDEALHHLAEVVKATLGIDNASKPGMGAAGGLAYGLVTFCGGRLRPGFEQVAKFLDLDTRIPSADVVLTGEGRLDAQSHYGKGTVSLARMARAHRKPVVIFAGSIDPSVEWRGQFDDAVEVSPVRPESASEATALIERAARDWMRRFCDARSNRA
jgi:glycerate kinase